ncbi:ABC transporter substrate-binding protein [Thermohalobacter berrensis]|uniref:Diguanylate phosphodiesterase n=1 Tax=Thermohalobacter berrensis TaxID=99594 RepID=A0A419T8I5_9FIRM|nr:ABC transporter substrate-binding protein [Thermohalobacter berrensis]RKD33791.1 diguanylate phosphodiesterase [Thermohalobacter berrensis]
MGNKNILIISFILILSLLAGCGQDNIQANEKLNKNNDNLVIRLEGGDWGYPTPFLHYRRGPGAYKMKLIFDSLLEKDEKGLIPWLAKEWEIKNDGKEYIFKLNKNIKWHDGNKLTADDVKFTFEYYKAHPPVWNNLIVNGKNIIENVDIIDDYTIKFIVNEKNATYLERVGTMPIIPKHIWENVKDPLKFYREEAVIGCGPYKLTNYSREQGIYKFKAFENYWGPKQKVDVIEFVPVSDPILAFEKGDIDTLMASPDILNRYENNEGFKVTKNKPFWGYRLIFNMDNRPELKDKSLRKVFAYGINRDELVQKVARGAGIVASMGYLPKAHKWYNPDIKKYNFDIEKARKLINGKEYSFKLLIGNSPKEVKIAELIKLSLSKVGINIEVKSVDNKTRDGLVKKGDFELAIIGHGGWGRDPDLLRDMYYSSETMESNSPASGSLPGFYNEKINELALLQMKQLNFDERKETIYKLQEVIAQEVPQIPLFNTIGYFVFRPLKYDGWMYTYDHHYPEHCKLSYLERK